MVPEGVIRGRSGRGDELWRALRAAFSLWQRPERSRLPEKGLGAVIWPACAPDRLASNQEG